MEVYFTRSHTLGSYLIRLLTGSQWSHCGVVDGPYIIDSMQGFGVRRRSLRSFLDAFPEHELVTIPGEHLGAMQFYREQVGKPYDGEALWGFLMPWRDWQDDSKWFCSELIAAGRQGWSDSSRFTPGALYDLLKRCV